MDEREAVQSQEIRQAKGRGKRVFFIAALLLLLLAGIVFYTILKSLPPKGYENYAMQMEQYYVEYSEQYDYWDVLTVEYPALSGIGEEVQEQVNSLLYDAAMDRVYYWHLFPNDMVKEFRQEHFSIFGSDVSCQVPFHSQYLISVRFQEAYCAGNPVWMTNLTERVLTVDLLTGEAYELLDIFEVNRDFISLWDWFYSEETEEEPGDEETLALLLSWFLGEDSDLNEEFQCHPCFYVTEDKDFVIGLTVDPVLARAVTYEPVSWGFFTRMDAKVLEPFRTDSVFWDRYEKSEAAGEVLPCEEKHENIWLGEGASVWDWEY